MNFSYLWQYFAFVGTLILAFNLTWTFLIMLPITYLFAFLKVYKLSLIFRVVGFYLRASIVALLLARFYDFKESPGVFIFVLIISMIFLIDILWHTIYVWSQRCLSLLDYSFFQERPESLIFNVYLLSFSLLFFIFSCFKPFLARNILSDYMILGIEASFSFFFVGVILKIIGGIYFVYHLYAFIKRLFFGDVD